MTRTCPRRVSLHDIIVGALALLFIAAGIGAWISGPPATQPHQTDVPREAE